MIWLFLICWSLWAITRLSLTAPKERTPSLLARIPRPLALWGQGLTLFIPFLALILDGSIHDLFLWLYSGPVIIVTVVLVRAYGPALPMSQQPPRGS
ncbi:hypothetical protein PT277_03635 [Acetobacteraceae bacterium ESL0709]|nr:hypothetical protein [Acetobacteraceae bacterium ESL0697]MDF7677792.1 hypothetical protein [Acetobacteraceae bacterium ESL0709]